MERKTDFYVISDDEAPQPKRRHLNPAPGPAPKPLRGMTAIGRHGPVTKSRFKLPDGPNANPRDIFPLDNDFKEPPGLAFVMDGITHPDNEIAKASAEENKLKSCLAKIREIFPDISRDHVRKLYDARKKEFSSFRRTEAELAEFEPSQHIIEQLLEADTYPKEQDKKRKRAASNEEAKAPAEPKYDAVKTPLYLDSARKILEYQFPKVPSVYVRLIVVRNKTLSEAFAALDASERTFATTEAPGYQQLRKERKAITDTELFAMLPIVGPERNQLIQELMAAREKRRNENEMRRREKELADMEAQNEKQQAELGALVECQCCYSDIPLNRTIHCQGNDGHFFCYDCIRNGANAQIGLMRYEMKCFDTSGCQSGFGRKQLRGVLGESIMDKLDTIQQRQEIEAAGIEGLHECPFCDFRAICPDVEEDREFRCCNPECEKVSCRLCNLPSHIPKTCTEAKKEEHLSARHLVEEAMSEALMRTCPKCKVKIVKEDGCNKMVCTKCRAMMCYVCKKDISKEGYNHFNQGRFGPSEPGKCAVHDNVGTDRHREEVENAQREAIQKARGENPDLSEKDVDVDLPARKDDVVLGPNGPLYRLDRRIRPGLLDDGYLDLGGQVPAPLQGLRPPQLPPARPQNRRPQRARPQDAGFDGQAYQNGQNEDEWYIRNWDQMLAAGRIPPLPEGQENLFGRNFRPRPGAPPRQLPEEWQLLPNQRPNLDANLDLLFPPNFQAGHRFLPPHPDFGPNPIQLPGAGIIYHHHQAPRPAAPPAAPFAPPVAPPAPIAAREMAWPAMLEPPDHNGTFQIQPRPGPDQLRYEPDYPAEFNNL